MGTICKIKTRQVTQQMGEFLILANHFTDPLLKLLTHGGRRVIIQDLVAERKYISHQCVRATGHFRRALPAQDAEGFRTEFKVVIQFIEQARLAQPGFSNDRYGMCLIVFKRVEQGVLQSFQF